MRSRSGAAPGQSRDEAADDGFRGRRSGPFSNPSAKHAARRLQRNRPVRDRSPCLREKPPRVRPGSVLPERRSAQTSSCHPRRARMMAILEPVVRTEPYNVQIVVEVERGAGHNNSSVRTRFQAAKVQTAGGKVNVEVFGLYRPVATNRIFHATADGPADRFIRRREKCVAATDI